MRAWVAWVAAASLLLAGCGRSHRKEIAVVPKGTAHQFWQGVHAGALAAGRAFNVDILWNGPAQETDSARQLEIIDSMIARRVDGLAIAAADRNALNAPLERAAAAKIPVAIFDSGVDSQQYMTFVATNNYAAGAMAARKLAGLIGARGKIAVVLHVPGSYSSMEREKGFEETIAREYPGIQIAARQFGMSDRAKALAAAENILAAHPDLAGIFASAEPSSVGTARALDERGAAGKIKFVAFDATEGLVKDLESGTIDALIAQDPYKIGYEAVKSLSDKLNGRTPPRQIDLSASVITKADLAKPAVQTLLFPPAAR